ncbi:beta-carotene 15,15'-dioxygenase, Brp/Blh family [Hymenobacter caeli]|uniref:Probable beta-carotene 15,15'-dioxygenase n=1 Tax=Hymenobacter caeli TaxID=2735894 RepID=A0ABX2FS31_9BACT|nr:beta-carotene 15,15'-dioxygenase, Brp/Blh family [Hymenobacter caeli]NRT19247.1 Brp/Blh family beta-carotene 15,15'-monooxygenase [Hymenobacter caeli]
MRPVYLLVLVCTAVGGLFPASAALLLGPPLAVGLVGLGIAHGACDHLLLPAAPPARAAAWGPWWQRGLLLGYVALAGAVLAAWYWLPTAALLGFFALSAWHWGSADAATLRPAPARAGRWWLLHGAARGLVLFAVPALAWPVETRALCNDLLALTRGQAVPAPLFGQVAAGLGGLAGLALAALWAGYGALGQWRALRTDVGETALLALLLLVLRPALASGVYFVGWHSLRHVLRLVPLLPGPPPGGRLLARLRGFWKLALPLLSVSVAGLLGVAWWLGPALLAHSGTLVALLLLAASVVTLPHTVLVTGVLDRCRWAPRPAPEARVLTALPGFKMLSNR